MSHEGNDKIIDRERDEIKEVGIFTIKFVCETEKDRDLIEKAVKKLEYEENMNPFSTERSQATLVESPLLDRELEHLMYRKV
jgi:choline kinase